MKLINYIHPMEVLKKQDNENKENNENKRNEQNKRNKKSQKTDCPFKIWFNKNNNFENKFIRGILHLTQENSILLIIIIELNSH